MGQRGWKIREAVSLDVKKYLERRRRQVDKALERWIVSEKEFPPQVHKAMRYSLFAGGKRLRPILVLAAAEAVGGRAAEALPVGCALEIIHTYSLIHDDLPSMDDDDLRRGMPTSHKVFGEAVAILAGDALLTEAFHLLSRSDLMKKIPPRRRIEAISAIAWAAGSRGMVGGQVMDMATQGTKMKPEILEYIHSHKTGALLAASLIAGGLIGGGSPREIRDLDKFGQKLGLAFQIVDDLLDVQGEASRMGKAVGKDQAKGKATYPALFGVEESQRRAEESIQEALGHLAAFNWRANPLRAIAKYILQRTN